MDGLMIIGGFLLVLLMVAVSVWLAGLWNAIITFCNLLISALVATAFYPPLALEFAHRSENVDYSVIAEFVSFWLLFVLTFMVIRIGAEVLTRHHLKFDPITELAGRSVMAICISLTFCSVFLYSLHMAPMPARDWWGVNFDRGSSAFGLGLDRWWSGYARYASLGPLAENPLTGKLAANVGRVSPGGEQVSFANGIQFAIPPGERFRLHEVPRFSDYQSQMKSFRYSIQEHFNEYEKSFLTDPGNLSTTQIQLMRDEAQDRLDLIAALIRNSIEFRGFGLFGAPN